jgi:hypothetical protein
MVIKELFSGVAIIIDDKINDEKGEDNISQISKKLEENHIPLLKYESLPNNSEIKQFKNISFILLDWELKKTIEVESKTPITEKTEIDIVSISSNDYQDNIDFIEKIKETTFAPIFIFSRLAPEAIIERLSRENLYSEDSNNYIFVKKKAELFSKDGKFLFFPIIKRWLKNSPSIYVLKEWEQSLNKAKRDLFWSFYEVNHNWPSVLQDTFTKDSSDVNYELGNFIFKNIMARTEPIRFEEEILKLKDDQIKTKDIRKILEAERFIKKDSLPPDIPFTGDLYKLYKYELSKNATSEKELFFLNIRPECDIAHASNPEIYCIECEIIDEDKIIVLDAESKSVDLSQILFKNGSFIDKTDSTYLPFVFDQKIMVVKLKDLKIFKWKQELFPKKNNGDKRTLNSTRIGRILPPYITRIQQKYTFYLQRQGLPAIPKNAIIGG